MKYTDARYPEKINDLIDNEGNVNPEIIPPAPTPEPGLKLYSHNVRIKDSKNDEYEFYIVSAESTQIIDAESCDLVA